MLKPKLTKTELNKWYKDEYVQIASHPVKTVGEWSLVKVTSPYVKKPFRCRSDFYLSTYVLRKNKVMFSIDSPYNTISEPDPERHGCLWVRHNPKTDKWGDIAGKYSLETFLTKVHNGEIYEGGSGLTATDLYNRYKIPLSVLNKFGFVTIPMASVNFLYQKSAFDDDAYDMWREKLRKARKAGLKYNNKDRWE